MTKQSAFDPYAIFEALDRERVSYVVVGAFARVVHGSAETTRGLDLVPSLREETCAALGGRSMTSAPERAIAGRSMR